jgi:hypothetical protein
VGKIVLLPTYLLLPPPHGRLSTGNSIFQVVVVEKKLRKEPRLDKGKER